MGSIIERIQAQGDKVVSFYTSGTLRAHSWVWESEADFLIAGIKNPFMLKLEVTHPWGRPILHILIKEGRLEVLSFTENRLYVGIFTPRLLARFFPVKVDHDLMWAALRGYPHLLDYDGVSSGRGDQIVLFNGSGNEIAFIDLYSEGYFPKSAYYPETNLHLAFSGYRQSEGIDYAGEVEITGVKGNKRLVLQNRKMVFNKAIPGEIFTLEKPPMFETVLLEEKD